MKVYDAKSTVGDNWQGSKWIRPEKRLAIYLRDDFTCLYCGRNMCQVDASLDLTLDHVTCRSNGGDNSEFNLVTACRKCNSARGNKKLWQWASEAAVLRVKRNKRRSLKKYLSLAKGILGTTHE